MVFSTLYQFVTGAIRIIWFLLAAFVEEPWLRDQFKEDYYTYCKEVPSFI
jgi:protein-S-isoprenylcysteine O-methyltransferase Ste14